DGAPLYAVPSSFFPCTSTAPTFRLPQRDLVEAIKAISIKYVSQSLRIDVMRTFLSLCGSSCATLLLARLNRLIQIVDNVLNIFRSDGQAHHSRCHSG